jgi:iron complex outermembrane receptor protein
VQKSTLPAALTLAFAATLHAEETPKPDAEKKPATQTLPELVVTASAPAPYSPPKVTSVTGLTAPIKELPVTVNTLSEQFLKDTSARRIRDLVGYIPGVNASEDSGGTGDLLNIRGFDFIYQTYVNGMRNRLALQASREFSNIDRVEIFKGPGGVEFGAGDPGGFVNYVTKKPQTTQSLTLGTEVGSYDYYGAYLDATGPLWRPGQPLVHEPDAKGGTVSSGPASQDDLGVFYRMIASGDTADSFRNTYASDRVMIAPSIQWNYAEDSSLLLEFQYGHHNQPYDRGVIYMEGAGFKNNFSPIDRTFHQPDDYLDTDDTRTSAYWTHKLNENVTLKLTGEINTTDVNGNAVRSPYTYLLYKPGTNEWNGDPNLLRTTQALQGHSDSFGIKPEIALNFETGPVKHTGLLGFNYLYTEVSTRSQDGFDLRAINIFNPNYHLPPVALPPADPSDPNSIPTFARDFELGEQIEEYGVYYQHKLDFLNDRLHVLGGVRWDSYDDQLAFTRNRRTTPRGPLKGYSDDNSSFRLGVVGDITKNISLFAGFSDSFQPQEGVYANGDHAEALEATSFEGGVKASFLDNRLQSTLSIYQIKRENMLETDPNDPTFTFVVPVGTVNVRGIEWETTGLITDDLTVQGGLSVMDSEITDTLDASTRGNEFYNVPNFQAGVRVRYDTSSWLVKGLSVGGGVVYVGDREGDAANTFELPSYTRFDAGLYYQWRNWNFKLTCENVFDKTYYLATQGVADIVQPGAPRLFTLGAEVKF